MRLKTNQEVWLTTFSGTDDCNVLMMLTVVDTYSIVGTRDESGRTSETIDIIKQYSPSPFSIPAEKKKWWHINWHSVHVICTPLFTERPPLKYDIQATVVTAFSIEWRNQASTPKHFLKLGTTNLIDTTDLGPKPKTNHSVDCFQYHVHYTGSDIP